VNPALVGSVFVPVLPEDTILLVWVTPSGRYVQSGRASAPLWTTYGRTRVGRPTVPRRYNTSAGGGLRVL
jgi:hypothetical protein